MKIKDYCDRYLKETKYKIIIQDNSVNILNYVEIKDFSATEIVVRNKKGFTKIKGKNLVIARMLDDEILITGHISTIEL